ncbi:hypothetical protein L6164_007515 [Bauhinia variegata]|uniref:Uncharacterized protein n=1 Tax=Bauhinia variegata TaxID=167791 RepID=A0ACB9PCT0_BAUVA|nr:hypothetical protein L6164_007515 [Bauhinia variegata]
MVIGSCIDKGSSSCILVEKGVQFIKNITRGGRPEPKTYYYISGGGYGYQGMIVLVSVQEHVPTSSNSGNPLTISSGNKIVLRRTLILKLLNEKSLCKQEVKLIFGYRWRKYGQKVVKGNPYPRAITRAIVQDAMCVSLSRELQQTPKLSLTVYEGKHNHGIL